MNMKQNKAPVSICITADIDYFETETIDGCLQPLFRVLDKYNVKMTIPVTAEAIKDYPERAEYVLKQGHEIAVHGDEHRSFYGSLDEQIDRMEKAKRIFWDVLGIVPAGFRAPRLEHDENTYLALAKTGFLYDSSRARNEILTKIPLIGKFSYEMAGFSMAKPFFNLAASFISRRVPARPFFIDNGLIELPVTGPSDWQSIVWEKGPRYLPGHVQRIADIWLDIVRNMKRKDNQVFVVLIHPCIISPSYTEAMDVFLNSVMNDKEVELKLLSDVAVSFLSQNQKAKIPVNASGTT